METNFQRMIALVTEAFDMRNDPEQLDVNEKVIARLQRIHPDTLSELNEDGPIVWILIFPTIKKLMKDFLEEKISEKELFNLTEEGISYDCIYLCSASVLPEYRKKGHAKRLTVEAINEIRKDYPIESLFVWAFSKQGEKLAGKIGDEIKLPVYYKQSRI